LISAELEECGLISFLRQIEFSKMKILGFIAQTDRIFGVKLIMGIERLGIKVHCNLCTGSVTAGESISQADL
jgi:hypothetical protein